ncbi:Flp pilus assembly complex ATPase component TadA [Candidatus Woesearchaeota archaeon]|nr:Flp pilus assembly complex ATPase component TadA [Candidatus Woesearchaeota archaeon]
MAEKLVPDTSVIIEGVVSKKITELGCSTIIIHEALLSELEHQANEGKEIGWLGLAELERLKQICSENNIHLEFGGHKPSPAQIKLATYGEIDAMIRDLAYEVGATLMTADKVQAKIARTKSIDVIEVPIKASVKKLKLEKFFDDNTMSIHLRENIFPFAKKGAPGKWNFASLSQKKLSRKEVQEIYRELVEQIPLREDAFIEIERAGSMIIQFANYRIVVTKPPFSDGWEITAVRPVKLLELEEYKLSEKLGKRIKEQAEGILIAGAPGQGKTTFARALAIYYASENKVVKTVEAPRDLILPDNITQFAISHGTPEEVHDILLLSRPDYTIFDEMRNTADFRLFADLRLSGVGMVGIVHATTPIDAIQRFIGRIELGVIPQIIDTVIFIKAGGIAKLYEVKMTVKVPAGMTEEDLARPVVTVSDFDTNRIEYEIYSYGEETVVVPVEKVSAFGKEESSAHKIAAQALEEKFKKYSRNAKIEVNGANRCTVYLPENEIGSIIGKQGKRIEKIEKELGIRIDVKEMPRTEEAIEFDVQIKKRYIQLIPKNNIISKDVDIYVNDEYLLTAKVGNKNIIKIHKFNPVGKDLLHAITTKKNIEVRA